MEIRSTTSSSSFSSHQLPNPSADVGEMLGTEAASLCLEGQEDEKHCVGLEEIKAEKRDVDKRT